MKYNPFTLPGPHTRLRTGFVVITPGVIPVNMLSARSKLAGAASTLASNLSETDSEFLPNSQKNIQDSGCAESSAFTRARLAPGQLEGHPEFEGEPCRAGKGPREGGRLGKNGMSSLIGVFHEGQGEGQGETHSLPQLCSLLSGAQLLPPSPGNQRQVYMEPGLRDVTEARKAGGGGGRDGGWALLIIRD